MAKKHHPDANPGNKASEERFKEINEAYEVLGDEEKRKKYDQFGNNPQFANGYDFDPSQYGYGGSGGGRSYTYTSGDGAGDFSDFFQTFFGGGGMGQDEFDFENLFGRRTGRGQPSAGRPGQDLEMEVHVRLHEAFQGITRAIAFQRDGKRVQLQVKIPKGVQPGEKIRLSGQGGAGSGSGKSGDLYLKIHIDLDKETVMDGLHIHKRLDVYPWEALLGGKKEVENMGEKFSVNIPAGLQSDRSIRLGGRGYIDKKGHRGDLFVKIRIVNPEKPDKDVQALYEQLRQIYHQQ